MMMYEINPHLDAWMSCIAVATLFDLNGRNVLLRFPGNLCSGFPIYMGIIIILLYYNNTIYPPHLQGSVNCEPTVNSRTCSR